MQSSIRDIRSRLLFTLGKAFIFVLLLAAILFIGATSYLITAPFSPFSRTFPDLLKGYYSGHGSWDGVENIVMQDEELQHLPIILLDKDQHIVLDLRPDTVKETESHIQPDVAHTTFNLIIENEEVGTIILFPTPWAERLIMARGILIPLIIITIVLSLFMVVVSILLTRRFVNPLADVIFAAKKMSQGKFDTRISGTGHQDLRSLSDSFNNMASALEKSDQERRDMFADIAHELRTPLSILRGRLEGIVDGIYPGNVSQISTTLEQAYVLERLINDLRLLTLAETRQLQFELHPVLLGKLVERTINIFSAEAEEKKISLYLENNAPKSKIQLDPQRTEQIIGNLLSNALRYVPEDGKVWISIDKNDGYINLQINDNGPGVPEKDLPHLFQRFWRGEKSRSRASGGAGLGLAIASQLVEAQGGEINATKSPEGGLQVSVLFPLMHQE